MTTVAVAYLHRSKVGHNFMQSMLDMRTVHERTQRFPIMTGAGSLVEGRNQGVRLFLDESDAEWLWWLDDDMGFEPDCLDRLIEAADPAEKPIMGALCFAQGSIGPDGMGGYRFVMRPVILATNTTENGKAFGFVGEYPRNEVVRCDATGSACIVIHRTVLEAMRSDFGDAWYDRIEFNDTIAGEDVSFCLKAQSLGFPTHVHTGVPTNHLKPCWLSEVKP